MRLNKLYTLLPFFILMIGHSVSAQEMNAFVTVSTTKLQATDPAIFKTLERDLQEFLNQQRWTEDEYKPYERIETNYSINITSELGGNSFKADIAIKAIRPVYGSEYKTVLINHVDRDIVFSYQEFQPIEDGTEFYKDNLSAVFSFYAHFILGLDAESFALGAGDEHFQLAQNILNQIPPHVGDQDKGWTSLNKKTTRYWMVENMLSARYKTFKEAWYNYHRKSLDVMHSNLEQALTTMVDALRMVDKTHAAYPNTVGVIMFVSAKSDEIVEIFKTADRAKKTAVYEIMRKLDPSGAGKYNAIRN